MPYTTAPMPYTTALHCTPQPAVPVGVRKTLHQSPQRTARPSPPAPELLPGPLPPALGAARRGGGSAPRLPSCPSSLGWPPGTSPPLPPCHGAGVPTTSLSSPTEEEVPPLPLGELLSWVSEVSRPWMGWRAARDAAAPRPRSPAQWCWMFIPTPLTAATEPAPPSPGPVGPRLRTLGHPSPSWGAAMPGLGAAPQPLPTPQPAAGCWVPSPALLVPMAHPPAQGRPGGAVPPAPPITATSLLLPARSHPPPMNRVTAVLSTHHHRHRRRCRCPLITQPRCFRITPSPRRPPRRPTPPTSSPLGAPGPRQCSESISLFLGVGGDTNTTPGVSRRRSVCTVAPRAARATGAQ